MLDQDARPEASALPEPTLPNRPSRGRRRGLFVVLAVIAAVALAAAAFAVGRASDDGSSSAVTTRPVKSAKGDAPAKAAPPATVPSVALGEAIEKVPDKPLDNATRDALAADLM